MIYPSIKDQAYKIDPECWKSYSGQPKQIKRRIEARRNLALNLAQIELGVHVPSDAEAEHDAAVMTNEGYGVTTSDEGGRGCVAQYTVSEIDRMRKAIIRNPAYRLKGIQFHGQHELEKHVEELLRTHMLNGTAPGDLEKAADDEWAERRVRRLRELADNECVRRLRELADNESAFKAAKRITCDLPLPLERRKALRQQIEDAIKDAIKTVIAKFFS